MLYNNRHDAHIPPAGPEEHPDSCAIYLIDVLRSRDSQDAVDQDHVTAMSHVDATDVSVNVCVKPMDLIYNLKFNFVLSHICVGVYISGDIYVII